MAIRLVLGAVAVGALGLGLSVGGGPDDRDRGEAPDRASERGRAGTPERIEVVGIANFFRLGPQLYSGSQPEGRAGFEALKRLGVRTVISVDGTRPDLETAHRLGLRYVHLPFGYDGVPESQATRLVKATRDLPGPVFIHCHHGQHRGPAAAAVCAIANDGWSRDQARDWLVTAGTDPNYKGLFATVDQFVTPRAEELARLTAADLPGRAELSDLVEAMVAIDGHWDHLKAVAEAGFRTPPGHPDIDPPHEALMLAEQFRELARSEAAEARGASFIALMRGADRDASDLEAALRQFGKAATPDARKTVESAFEAAGRRCSTCHARYRNVRPVPSSDAR